MEEVLDNVAYARAHNTEHQMKLLQVGGTHNRAVGAHALPGRSPLLPMGAPPRYARITLSSVQAFWHYRLSWHFCAHLLSLVSQHMCGSPPSSIPPFSAQEAAAMMADARFGIVIVDSATALFRCVRGGWVGGWEGRRGAGGLCGHDG